MSDLELHKNQTAVFLSYASEDNEIVRSFFEGLTQLNALPLNIDIFFDREVIHAGQGLTEKITDGLERSEYLIIFLFGAMKPSHSWTGLEVGFYKALIKADIRQFGETKRQIIPIYLDELPDLFADTKGIGLDLDRDDIALSLEQFVERYRAVGTKANELADTFKNLFDNIATLAEVRVEIDSFDEDARRAHYNRIERRMAIVGESIVPNIMTTVFHWLRQRITTRKIEQYFLEFEFPYDVNASTEIKSQARLLPFANALQVFGLPGVSEPITWKRFKAEIQRGAPHTYAEILAAIERCVISAISADEELDNEQIFRSPYDNRVYRMVITRQYTYYDGRVTVHMYIIDVLNLQFAVGEDIETIMSYINLSLKFRVLFLEWGAKFSVQKFQQIERDVPEAKRFIQKFMQQLDIIEEESKIFSLDELQKIKIYGGKISGKTLAENMQLWEQRRTALTEASKDALAEDAVQHFDERREAWRNAQAGFVELTEQLNREFGLRAIKQLSKEFRQNIFQAED